MYDNPKYQPNLDERSASEAARLAEHHTEEFRKVLANPVDTIPYADFRRVMLPMLAEIAHGREFDLDTWFTMISHPSVELSVLDDITGEERYRLSSVWQQTDISCKDDDLEGMSVYVDGLNMMKSTDYFAAHDRLMELAEDRIDHATPEQIIEDAILAINRLNTIFRDHELPELPDPAVLRESYRRVSSGESTEDPAEVIVAPVDEPIAYDEL